jgi:hypothetical protein
LIAEDRRGVVYKVKHFDPDFRAWEEKDEHVKFPLVRLEKGTAYFRGLTIQRDGDRLTQYLAMKQADGSYNEVTLTFQLATMSESAPK